MKRIGGIAAALAGAVTVFALAACSSNSGSSGKAQDTRTSQSNPSTHTATTPSPSVPAGATAAEIAAMFGCVPAPTATESDSFNVDLGPKPASRVFCTAGGQKYEVDAWKSMKDQTATDAIVLGLASDIGEEYYAEGPLWNASLDLEQMNNDLNTPAQTAASLRAARMLTAKLGGHIVHIKP